MKAGIDDVGSGDFKGYSAIILGDQAEVNLKAKSASLLTKKFTSFHGKCYTRQESGRFEEFFGIIKACLQADGECANFQLIHKDIYNKLYFNVFSEFVTKVLGSVSDEIPPFIVEKFGEIVVLCRDLGLIRHKNSSLVHVEIDKMQIEDIGDSYNKIRFQHFLGVSDIDYKDALVLLVNAYKKQKSIQGPKLASVRICNAKDSIVIQAADVIANFGMNYIKTRIRKCNTGTPSSQSELRKAEIFQILFTEPYKLDFTDFLVTEDNIIQGPISQNPRVEITAFPE